MFCTRCGIELDDRVNYCSACGSATHNAASSQQWSGAQWSGAGTGPQARLSRPEQGKKIAGVCAGVARYFGLDVTLVRILWLLLAFWPPGAGVIAYIVCWIAMPKDPLLLAAPPGAATAAHPAQ